MITTNVFRRVFYVSFGTSSGTAFTIDIDSRQYLVTARHVCEGVANGNSIGVFRNGDWQHLLVRVVGLGAPKRIDTDVAVLALEAQISPSFPMLPTSAELIWGQEVFFLGFPYGLHTTADVNDGYPLPLVKGALMSGAVSENQGPPMFLLDGHNNPGFSGGPVVFRPANAPGREFRVMGVVSAFRTEDAEVKFQGKPTGLTSPANTGIVVCPSIKQVTQIIASNPTGPVITY